MPIAIACPSCGARLTAPDAAAGKRVKCAKCQTVVPIPESDSGFEVVEAPPVARPARPAVPVRKPTAVVEEDDDKPLRPKTRSKRPVDDEDDEGNDRPRRRRKAKARAS